VKPKLDIQGEGERKTLSEGSFAKLLAREEAQFDGEAKRHHSYSGP
jgi:hypothetical protein